jgi:hypothetical protein
MNHQHTMMRNNLVNGKSNLVGGTVYKVSYKDIRTSCKPIEGALLEWGRGDDRKNGLILERLV